jgi:hypothetical protein
LRDKQLGLKIDVGLISLKNNGLHKKANAIYDIWVACRGRSVVVLSLRDWTRYLRLFLFHLSEKQKPGGDVFLGGDNFYDGFAL